MRYELTDHEWTVIKPMLPKKPRGVPSDNLQAPLYLAAAYLGIGDEEQARASMAEFLKREHKFSIAESRRWVPTPNPIVARQR